MYQRNGNMVLRFSLRCINFGFSLTKSFFNKEKQTNKNDLGHVPLATQAQTLSHERVRIGLDIGLFNYWTARPILPPPVGRCAAGRWKGMGGKSPSTTSQCSPFCSLVQVTCSWLNLHGAALDGWETSAPTSTHVPSHLTADACLYLPIGGGGNVGLSWAYGNPTDVRWACGEGGLCPPPRFRSF